jgi:hypothetical protein
MNKYFPNYNKKYYQMDSNLVLTNDYLLGELFNYLHPKELIILKQVNHSYNELITNKIIKKSCIQSVHRRLQELFPDIYSELIDFMQRRNMVLFGPFIAQCILNEYWNDNTITMIITKDNINPNIFLEYYKITSKNNDQITMINETHIHNDIACLDLYDKTIDWFSDGDKWGNDALSINEIGERQIYLDIYNTPEIDLKTLDDRFSDMLNFTHNIFYIKNGISKIKIRYIKNIIYKKEYIDLSINNSLSTDANIYVRNNMQFIFAPLQKYIMIEPEKLIYPIIIYNEELQLYSFLGTVIKSCHGKRIKCNPIEIINHDKCHFAYIDMFHVKLRHNSTCNKLTFTKLEYYNCCIFFVLKDNNKIIVTQARMIKYEKNNNIFSNYDTIFNDQLYKPITNLNIGNIVENKKIFDDPYIRLHLQNDVDCYGCDLILNN